MAVSPSFDAYTSLVVEAEAARKIVLQLQGEYLVFYVVTSIQELRVRAYGSEQVYTLARGVKHVHGIAHDDKVLLYVVGVSGSVTLITYRYFGDPAPRMADISIGNRAQNLHVVWQHGWFLLASSDGARLWLIQARDPEFLQDVKRFRLYSNTLDMDHYVDKPVLGVHPDDYHQHPKPTNLTVGVERTTLATGDKEVGYFIQEIYLD